MITENKTYKKRYTIGALFTEDLDCILLIEKARPEWQKGKLNLPGGHIEDGETSAECVRREFIEEVGIDISDWLHIGRIDNPGNYYVDIFTAIAVDGTSMISHTDEEACWEPVTELPARCISNLHWIIPFAQNTHRQGNIDALKFGVFQYQNF